MQSSLLVTEVNPIWRTTTPCETKNRIDNGAIDKEPLEQGSQYEEESPDPSCARLIQ